MRKTAWLVTAAIAAMATPAYAQEDTQTASGAPEQ